MTICLINNLYKPFNRGGAEKVCETLARGLLKAGHEVFVITAKTRNQKRTEAGKPRIYYLNSSYYNLNKLPKFFHLFWQIWNMFNFIGYFKIKNILRREKCDAVITSNLMGVGFLTPLAIRSLKIKHLHIAHDIQLIHPSGLVYYKKEKIIDGFFAKIYSKICRKLFKSVQIAIFPSRWLRDFYAKRDFFQLSKVMVLPNPVDSGLAEECPGSDNFNPVKYALRPNQRLGFNRVKYALRPNQRLGFNRVKYALRPNQRLGFNRVKFLFIGQIEEHKGVLLLLDSFNKIKEKYPEVELLLAGDGSQIELARERAAGNNNIKFLGWPGDEAVDKLLSFSHSLVYPSLVYENCPNAIQRALTAGSPVLGSDLGGITELLSDGAGIVFKPADVNDLAEKMVWLIENKNSLNNLTEAGRRRAEDFKVNNYVKELEKIIY